MRTAGRCRSSGTGRYSKAIHGSRAGSHARPVPESYVAPGDIGNVVFLLLFRLLFVDLSDEPFRV